jgi:Acyl-CoA carboxylase epsilon subunit
MIEITKGNPTPEEIAALVAVLTLARRTTEPRLTSPRAGEWRRSTLFAESSPAEPNRRDRRWRTRTTGWSCVGPAHAPLPHRAVRRRDPNVS